MIKLTRYRDPWSNDPKMKCFAEKYPYGEVTEPLIEEKEDGYFIAKEELTEFANKIMGTTIRRNEEFPLAEDLVEAFIKSKEGE